MSYSYWMFVVDWTVSLQNSDVKNSTPNMTIFWDMVLNEIIKAEWKNK